MRATLIGLLAVLWAGCFMTADESLWRDGAPRTDAPRGDARKPDAAPAEAALDRRPADHAADASPRDLPSPDSSCKQMVLQLASKDDDGQVENDEYFHPDGESIGDIWMGSYDSSLVLWGFFRFQLSQALPATANITAATLELWGHYDFSYSESGWNPATNALEVFAESSADPPVVTSEKDGPFTALGRPVTAASVRWPASGGLTWAPLQYHTSPNIAPALQEVVKSKGGLASGAHVQLWVRGAQLGYHLVTAAAYGTPSFKPSRLTISYCP
jgi:hypothetical protein